MQWPAFPSSPSSGVLEVARALRGAHVLTIRRLSRRHTTRTSPRTGPRAARGRRRSARTDRPPRRGSRAGARATRRGYASPSSASAASGRARCRRRRGDRGRHDQVRVRVGRGGADLEAARAGSPRGSARRRCGCPGPRHAVGRERVVPQALVRVHRQVDGREIDHVLERPGEVGLEHGVVRGEEVLLGALAAQALVEVVPAPSCPGTASA